MSLVGSLEDLGLGDILQIVSLSRKSGLLLLRSEDGEGRIVFRDGLVRAAFVKGEAEDLRALLQNGGFLDTAEFDRAVETAKAHGDRVADVLARLPNFSKERLNSLRREQVERSVFRMFAWKFGEFSFEIRDEIDERDRELLLPSGINAQYLTMEATRLGDEFGKDGDDDIQFGMIDDGKAAGKAGTEEGAAPVVAPAESPDLAASSAGPPGTARGEAEKAATDALALAIARRIDDSEEPAEVAAVASADPAPDGTRQPNLSALVLVDPDLAALEWQKSVLGPICRRIHIFQRADSGIARIRQYLRRGEQPFVLVSSDLPADPMGGIDGPLGLISRLRAHAPRMPIFLVHAGADPSPRVCGAADGMLHRPANHHLANRRSWAKVESDGAEMRRAIAHCAGDPRRERPAAREPAKTVPAGSTAAAVVPAADLRRLKEMSDRLRDPSIRGEVLSLILEFAAESFARVAIFMVRDDEALGIAQSGLDRAGGPSDAGFRAISFPAREPSWFRAVLDRREGVTAPPTDAGDHGLGALIGSVVAPEAYVAPIESNQQVVALVYADNLPNGAPIGETVALEIVLHEAGLALERALLERALAGAANRESL